MTRVATPGPCAGEWLRRAARALRHAGLALALALSAALPAFADDAVVVSQASVQVRRASDPGTFVEAQFDFQLPGPLRDALEHGIALYFAVDVEILRARWYWFDQRVVGESLVARLSYSPLTRQYRLARGGLAQPFDTLELALATLRRVRGWRVAEADALDGGKLRGRIRLHLDTSMLPRPFQFSALTDRDWAIGSDWVTIALPTEAPN